MAIREDDKDDLPVTGIDALLEPFYAACKPAAAFRVGTEAEKFGWLTDVRAPLPVQGGRSVQSVLHALIERFGWLPQREHPEGDVIALRRGWASITLEPAGQLELSGSPFASVHETQQELERHLCELHELSDTQHIAWLSTGFHPFATHADLPNVPKLRYSIMQRYLPTRGARSLDMMRRTCTVQANLDYASEADAMRKLRIGLALQPVVTAMFANSPLYEGARSSRVCERADVWLNMDPDRTGLLPFAWNEDASFRSYVEWALDVPMFLIKRGAHVIENTAQTFREFMRDGRDGQRATLGDWKTHLNTLFPEARLKHTLEMRGADAQPRDLLCAVPALWKGLLYDETALARAEALIAPLEVETVRAARPEIARLGLRASLLGRPVQVWAAEALQIAIDGLQRQNVRNARDETEAAFLMPIAGMVHDGECPASVLLGKLSEPPGPEEIVTATRL